MANSPFEFCNNGIVEPNESLRNHCPKSEGAMSPAFGKFVLFSIHYCGLSDILHPVQHPTVSHCLTISRTFQSRGVPCPNFTGAKPSSAHSSTKESAPSLASPAWGNMKPSTPSTTPPKSPITRCETNKP